MISRRALLAAAAPAALALGGCQFTAAGIQAGVNLVYNEAVAVAKILEAAVAKAASDVKTAVAMISPYIPTCCRLVVSMDSLAQTMVANGVVKVAAGSKTATVLDDLHKTATTSAIAVTAQTGALPTDPMAVATDILQLVSLVVSLTAKKVTPTAAATA